MPYTAAQLTQYFTTLSRGAQPDAATAGAISTASQQNAAGSLTDAQALVVIFNSTQIRATEEVAVASYAFFTSSMPSLAGIDYLVNNAGSGYNMPYYNGPGGTASNATGCFNVNNRYYNAALNLAANPGSVGNAAFVSQYGGLTLQQTITTAYNQIIGISSVGQAAADAGVAAISAAIPYFQQLARERVVSGGSVDIATKAIIAAYILEEGIKADVGVYSRALDQFDTALVMGGGVTNSNLVTTYGNNGANFNPANVPCLRRVRRPGLFRLGRKVFGAAKLSARRRAYPRSKPTALRSIRPEGPCVRRRFGRSRAGRGRAHGAA